MEKKSIKKNYIFNLIYQITLIIVPLIVTPYLSRVLLDDGVGKYSFSLSLISYFTLFATFGFDHYSQREMAKCQGDKNKQSVLFWEIIISRAIPVFASLFIHVILLLTNVYGDYSIIMQILTLNVISIAFDVSFFFQANEEFAKLTIRNVIIKTIGTILIFVLVKQRSDLWIYALIQSGMTVVSALSLLPSLIKRIKKVKLKEIKPLKHLWPAFKLLIPSIAISLYTIMDKSLIGFITQSNSQNGIYEQAEKIVKLSLTLVTCLTPVMISRNSSEIANGNHEGVKHNIYKSFNFLWLLGMPMMFGIIAVSDNLIPWFLGANFLGSSVLLKVFSPLIIFIGGSSILGMHYLIPYKKEKHYTLSYVFSAIINLFLNIILISKFQALGATIATIIAEMSVLIIMLFYARKDLSIKSIFKSMIKPLIASIIMFSVLLPVGLKLNPSVINTVSLIGIGALIYGLMILLMKEKFTFEVLTNIKNKLFKKNKTQNLSNSENNFQENKTDNNKE